jgi:hypothetical protein
MSMIASNKNRALSENMMEVRCQLVISGGSVSIGKVFPPAAAGDISVSDGGAGLSTITVKNFKGPKGEYNIQATPRVTSTMTAIVSDSYTGANLAFTVSTENDASTATDNVSVDLLLNAW